MERNTLLIKYVCAKHLHTMLPQTSSKNNSKSISHRQEPARSGAEPLVAIVILNWNGRAYLEKFLPFLIVSTYRNKIIIVADNGSTDQSVVFLEQHYPSIKIIKNNANLGFAKGYNSALKKVAADYYVLLNSDVEVAPGWIEPIIQLMEADKTIGACQPKILSYTIRNQFEYAGASGGWIDKLGYPFARGRIFDDCEIDEGQHDQPGECFWASGASMFVRASVYHELHGMDEFFFAHQEEIDLCWRMHMAGYKVYVEPASVVYHVGGGTLPKGNSLKTFLNFRNNLVMLYKNHYRPQAYLIISLRIFLDAVAAWKGLLAGDGGYFFAIGRAHLHFAGWVLFNQKESVFPNSRRPVSAGWYKGSVVWQYFVKHKKTFVEIVGNK